MTALDLIKEEIKNARELFEGTVADLTEDQLHKDPGGVAIPLGATYAHLIFSEDMTVQTLLQGKTALSESEWKGKVLSEPMAAMDENWSDNNFKWAKNVRINLQELREYSKAVYAATDEYVNSLKEEDLEKEIDLGSWGKKKLAEMFYSFLIGHTYSLSGEISALKGVQGLKGYPF